MELYWHRTRARHPIPPAGARWWPAAAGRPPPPPPPPLPPLHIQDKSWGRMACRYRPGQACATHRRPPSGGFQCSLLSKDKLSNRLLFYEFTPRSISQKRLRKILGLSCSTLRQNSVLWKVKKPGDKARSPGTGRLSPLTSDLWLMCTITNRNQGEEGRAFVSKLKTTGK